MADDVERFKEAIRRRKERILAERKAQEEIDAEERQRIWDESLRGRAINKAREAVQNTRAYQYAQEKKDALVNRATEIIINPAKNTLTSGKFWLGVLVFLILLGIAWFKNFLGIRHFFLTVGITIAGLIAIVIIFCFILYGWFTSGQNISKFYIATALFIWMLDMLPLSWIPVIGAYFGPPWGGFEFPLGGWNIPWVSIIFSSFSFALLYIFMVFNIIEKEYRRFLLQFFFIIISNYLITKFFPEYMSVSYFSLSIKYGYIISVLLAAVLIVLIFLAWKYDKNGRGAVSDFLSSIILIFVFSFFWMYPGWQSNLRAVFHFLFILAFGFGYIKPSESSNPWTWRILIALLLLIDFFGYGLLYSSDYLFLKFIPPIVVFVIFYCYHQETKKGQKNYTYPVAAMVLLVTFILIMSIKVSGLETDASVPFIAKQGTTFSEFYTQFTNNLREAIEGRLDIATAGLYRGNVEKNRYESLGVYFANIRAADPRFYQDEPITVWGSIQSKTYKDAVIINFNCYRWKDNKKIPADKTIPNIRFPIFTLEEVDTECTFLPKSKGDKLEISAGSNTVTLSAEYNFGTDAYLKAYFIDRDRFRAYAREAPEKDIETAIFKEFGIKDTKPVSVSTNGPIEIGIGTGQPLITVSEGYTIKPTIGITLTNRKEIQDKNKRIITKWDGKIKNITELVLLVPPGITLGSEEDLKKCYSKDATELLRCPCSMPFKPYNLHDCFSSCFKHVMEPCNKACEENNPNKDQQEKCVQECETTFNKCNEECTFLFEVNEGEGPTKEKYTGYVLDVDSIKFRDLNKDIDKHRSFVCRFEPSKAVLDATPITTRYFRVRARYNYLLENPVSVNVEQALVAPVPIEVERRAPEFVAEIPDEKYAEVFYNRANANEVKYSPIAFEIAKKYGVDYLFVKSIIQRESNWNPSAVGDGGDSFGIMQISTSLASALNCDTNYKTDQRANIECGVRKIKDLMDAQKNKNLKPGLRNIAGGYNCGEWAMSYSKDKGYENVVAWENPANCWSRDRKTNTRIYVDKVMEVYNVLYKQVQ